MKKVRVAYKEMAILQAGHSNAGQQGMSRQTLRLRGCDMNPACLISGYRNLVGVAKKVHLMTRSLTFDSKEVVCCLRQILWAPCEKPRRASRADRVTDDSKAELQLQGLSCR